MDKLNLKSKFDIFAGFAILGIVLMIIIPLPPFALDIESACSGCSRYRR